MRVLVASGLTGGAALLVLLAALAACTQGGPGAATRGRAMTPAERLYAGTCAACHRPDGSGIEGVQPPLAGTPVTVGEPAPLLDWVMYGRRPAALPRGVYAGLMPQFGYLSDQDLAMLLTHVRTSFGNHASAITPGMVAARRAAQRAR